MESICTPSLMITELRTNAAAGNRVAKREDALESSCGQRSIGRPQGILKLIRESAWGHQQLRRQESTAHKSNPASPVCHLGCRIVFGHAISGQAQFVLVEGFYTWRLSCGLPFGTGLALRVAVEAVSNSDASFAVNASPWSERKGPSL